MIKIIRLRRCQFFKNTNIFSHLKLDIVIAISSFKWPKKPGDNSAGHEILDGDFTKIESHCKILLYNQRGARVRLNVTRLSEDAAKMTNPHWQNSPMSEQDTCRNEYNRIIVVSELVNILLYVAFCTIMAISRQKEGPKSGICPTLSSN